MKVNVDFAYDAECDDATAVETWRREYAPRVNATIVGRANGWPVVALEGDDDAVRSALVVGGWDADGS